MKELIWIITLLALICGLAGIVIPVLPGLGLMATALLFHKLLLPDTLSWWTVALGFLFFSLGFAADWLGGLWGARKLGATKYGIAGAVAGLLIGLFWGLPGIIVGPLLGAALAELVFSRRGIKASIKAAAGVGLGIVTATGLKLTLGLILLGVFLINLFC